MMGFDALPPVAKGALVAAVVALLAAGLARLAGWPRVAAAAAGIGLAAGFASVLGVVMATPRQLAERLPLLVIFGLAAGLLAATRQRALAWAGLVLGLAGGAWWMAGAPMRPGSLVQAALAALGMLAAMVLGYWRGGGMPAMASAWALLAAGLAAAAARGPQTAFALAGLGALVGALPWRAGLGPAARLPLALALAGVAAVPVLGRAAPADMAAAAAPALALLFGPWLGRRLPGRTGAWLGPVLAGVPAVGLAFLLA